MAERVPEIAAVRVRGAGATAVGPRRSRNEDRFGIFEDESAAIALVVDGMGAHQGGEAASELVIETCERIFRGRGAAVLDELAETWWQGEHAGAERVRPFMSLPVRDRVELRERIQVLLSARVPDSMGDVAVLEAELASLLAIPKRVLELANDDICRRAERDFRWRGHGAAVSCVLFGAGQASIAHAGDTRVYRVRGGVIEQLTTDHTLRNDYLAAGMNPAEIESVPANVLTRALGMKVPLQIDVLTFPLQARDVFLLTTDGLSNLFSSDDLRTAIRTGIDAAAYLVARGERDRDRCVDNLTAVAIQIT